MPGKSGLRSTLPTVSETILQKEFIKELGLREGATSGDIMRAKNERYLFEKIAQYNLNPNATWADILRAEAACYSIKRNEID